MTLPPTALARMQDEPMHGVTDGMNWMMWGGLLIWLLVAAGVVWAAVVLVRHLRSNRVE